MSTDSRVKSCPHQKLMTELSLIMGPGFHPDCTSPRDIVCVLTNKIGFFLGDGNLQYLKCAVLHNSNDN